jgi:hypothetical protein
MPRPGPRKPYVPIRLPPPLLAWLNHWRAEKGLNRSAAIERLVKTGLIGYNRWTLIIETGHGTLLHANLHELALLRRIGQIPDEEPQWLLSLPGVAEKRLLGANKEWLDVALIRHSDATATSFAKSSFSEDVGSAEPDQK